MIEIENLHKSYGQTPVLRGIDLRVNKGEVVALIGPSGGGKSTLLRCLNGLEPFEQGQITIDGSTLRADHHADGRFRQELRQLRLRVGIVFQSFHLFPHLSVLDNLTLAPVKVLGLSRRQAEDKAKSLLRRVNLHGKEHVYPSALSGGEQQRVAIARALAMDLRVILFDEPTSSLDPELVGEVLAVISDLAAEGYTLVIVTHQMQFARRCADRVVFLDAGRILEEGNPDTFFDHPRSERIRGFLKSLI